MREFGQSILEIFSSILAFIHGLVEPVFGVHSWGWAIIGLTLLVRILLLPLAIKQTRSMKAMQVLQPQMKAIQDKYKTDRDMMRKDPDKYRARKQKQQQEMMALYQREGANPAASCLPLLAQAPVFVALFWTLRDEAELLGAPFYFITEATPGGLEKLVSVAGWPGWVLIVLMSGTMFFSQKQMMARNAATMADNPMAQQQKILLYVMPIFLAAISFQFPLGILLYWVTTNFWQIVQQAIILRESTKVAGPAGPSATTGNSDGDAAPGPLKGGARGATSGRPATKRPTEDTSDPASPDDHGSAEVENNSTNATGAGGTDDGPAEDALDGAAATAPSPSSSPRTGSKGRLPRRGGVR